MMMNTLPERSRTRAALTQIAPARGGRAARIVLYSHDTLGFGHLRRNLLIAGALKSCAAAPEILMIAGMREAGAFELPPGVDCMTPPPTPRDRRALPAA
jgi:predicted glycosyltransferase